MNKLISSSSTKTKNKYRILHCNLILAYFYDLWRLVSISIRVRLFIKKK